MRLLSRRNFFIPYLPIALGLLLTACRVSPPSDRLDGYLTIGIESNPLRLDPRYATDANSVRVSGLIYNSLLRADEKSELRPELAESWRMADDRTYVFDLRRDVRFHNGKQFTAEDVKYTFES